MATRYRSGLRDYSAEVSGSAGYVNEGGRGSGMEEIRAALTRGSQMSDHVGEKTTVCLRCSSPGRSFEVETKGANLFYKVTEKAQSLKLPLDAPARIFLRNLAQSIKLEKCHLFHN